MARGGRRQGTPGKQYANRQDLQTGPRALPVTTAPGQTYGAQTQQARAQQTVPMGSGPLPTQGAGVGDALGSAQGFNPPAVPQMGDPTAFPDQHVMAPPAPQQPAAASPLLKGVALLNALGADASPAVKALRATVQAAQANQSAP